jgi:hypothetical protein
VPKVVTPDCTVLEWETKAFAWLVSGMPAVCTPADQAKIEFYEHSLTEKKSKHSTFWRQFNEKPRDHTGLPKNA